MKRSVHSVTPSVGKRLALLLVCACLGVLVGVVGSRLIGSDLMYLAVPLFVALGWLFVANPAACEKPLPPPGSDPEHEQNAP